MFKRTIVLLLCTLCMHSVAQEQGTLTPPELPAIPHSARANIAAKELFGRAQQSALQTPSSIGFYAKGCLAGGAMLPINGPSWQAMRLSRNRNWGHPALIKFLQLFSADAAAVSGWNGLLIGDMAQPRGGPMRTGHASHQVGLDADIWWLPMPDRTLSKAEREQLSSQTVVRADRLDIDGKVWTPAHAAILRTASQRDEVQRVFVNPAIKKALCRDYAGQDWLSKIRPTAGHDYHFHVRLHCPPDDSQCTAQEPVAAGDGCDASLDWWFSAEALNPKPGPAKAPLKLADLPKQCEVVLDSE